MTQAFNLAQFANNVNSAGQAAAGTSLTGAVLPANGGTGLTTLTANNVILGNGTSSVQFVAPSTSGNVLVSTGTTWQSAASPGLPGPRGQVFTASGTFTVPTGITAVKVTVIGGGGNAANSTAVNNGSGGGGGGGVAIEYLTGLTPGAAITVTVGGASGTSSFGAFCSATGGATSVTNGLGGTGGAGGVGSGGTINITGSAGSNGTAQSGCGGQTTVSGVGGGSSGMSVVPPVLISVPGTAVYIASFGVPSSGFFSGGGGCVSGQKNATGFGNGGGGVTSGGSLVVGGTGSGGIVIVEF